MSSEKKSENYLTNGNLINKYAGKELSFKKGDNFFIENESYLGNFLVQGMEKDGGITFVRATGSSAGGDAIFDLAYLRRQYTLGKLKINNKKENKD